MNDSRPVWLLDVDGVLNAVRPSWGEPPFQGSVYVAGCSWKFRWSPSLLSFVRQTALDGGCTVRWATSWVEHADELSRLFRLPPLPVAFPPGTSDVTAAKLEAALAVVEAERRPLIWTDDEAIPAGGVHRERLAAAGVPVLLVRPDERRGLTREDAERIRSFVAAPLGR